MYLYSLLDMFQLDNASFVFVGVVALHPIKPLSSHARMISLFPGLNQF